jgi:hypothetical protein
MISTSRVEALIRFRCGCSKSLSHEVMCSPWLRGGPWQRIVVGRGLPSSKHLFLDGDAWRTPVMSGGGAQGLCCKNLFSLRVLCVKRKDLSLHMRFPRACIVKVFSTTCTCHCRSEKNKNRPTLVGWPGETYLSDYDTLVENGPLVRPF